MSNPEIAPNYDNGIPRCSYDACPFYDGKRCEMLGFEPDAICEPGVADMNALLHEIRDLVRITPFDPTPLEEPNPDAPWLPVGLLQKIDAVLGN